MIYVPPRWQFVYATNSHRIEDQPYWMGNLDRSLAENILQKTASFAFLVRSRSALQCITVLRWTAQSKIILQFHSSHLRMASSNAPLAQPLMQLRHSLIVPSEGGYRFEERPEIFPSVPGFLVHFHADPHRTHNIQQNLARFCTSGQSEMDLIQQAQNHDGREDNA